MSPDRLKLEVARPIGKTIFIRCFHDDTYTPLEKQYWMLKIILEYYDAAMEAMKKGRHRILYGCLFVSR